MASATVTGTVASLNSTGTGFRVEETWEGRDGRSSRRFWAVWFPKGTGGMAPPVNAHVKVTGLLGTKVSERDNRYVDHTINDAQVELLNGEPAPAADHRAPVQPYVGNPAYDTPPEDPWATAPIPESETPF
ncbi:hypothetical protein [Microbacterium jejuense]|uniref:hypothetical protein n=1 Tax=Microbacterium jejuense TaxID=1263637 RepID=UPI0031EC7CE7